MNLTVCRRGQRVQQAHSSAQPHSFAAFAALWLRGAEISGLLGCKNHRTPHQACNQEPNAKRRLISPSRKVARAGSKERPIILLPSSSTLSGATMERTIDLSVALPPKAVLSGGDRCASAIMARTSADR